MEYLSEKFGLVTDSDNVTENGQLFLAQLILLQSMSGMVDLNLNELMTKQLENSKVKKGLYHRNTDLIDRRIMSHDNLTGIFAWSYSQKTFHAKEIWNYLLTHLGTYDNSLGKTKQLSRFLPYNPANYFTWGLSANSKLYLIFLPFFVFNFLISTHQPAKETSGKILTWVELFPFKDHWLVKYFFEYFESQMKKQYGEPYLKGLFNVYFGGNSKEFPINKILGIGKN